MSPIWHAGVALILITTFVALVGLFAYQLYGPGIQFSIPDYLLPAGWATTTERANVADPLAGYPGVLFECGDVKALKAEFLGESVNLVLSDGRELILPQIASSEERRYANVDESFVFWNKGVTASIEESGVLTYVSCLQI